MKKRIVYEPEVGDSVLVFAGTYGIKNRPGFLTLSANCEGVIRRMGEYNERSDVLVNGIVLLLADWEYRLLHPGRVRQGIIQDGD
jgi:hypothetical protein